MALVNPNIAMSFRQPEFRPRNAMAEYAQMQQIQGGQQAQELAQFQLGAAQRAENVQNALNTAYSSSLDDKGNIDYSKLLPSLARSGGGSQIPGILKARAETEAARLKQQETQGKIDSDTFNLTDKKLKAAWNLIGSSTSPQAAIVEFTKGVKSGVFKAEEVAEDLQLLGSMTDPEQFLKYRRNAVGKLLDAKDQFASLIPNIARQDTGGAITSIQNNPMLPGYGEPVKGMTPITKTATIGETTAQGQLAVAQRNAQLAQEKFAFERANPGFELREDGEGNLFAINKRTTQAVPVTVGGAAPAAGPGMPGPRVPAPGVAAPDAAVAPGTQFRGKTGSLTESQGNATAYGMRMREANAILEPLEKAGKTNTGLIKGVVGGTLGVIPLIGDKLEDVSGSVFNALPQILGGLSPAQQQVAQARINFITAILRKESGAAIGRDEFATAEKNYFPKPGDDDAAIAQKQQARRTAIKAMEIQAGPGARQMGGAGGAGGLPGATANNPLALPIPGR